MESHRPPPPSPSPRSGRGPVAGSAADELIAALGLHLAEERVAEAALSRARERGLRDAADASQTLVGALIDLAERSEPVVIGLLGGRTHRGTVRAVGAELIVMESTAAAVLVRLAAVRSVRARGRVPRGADREPTLTLDMGLALAIVAEERPQVAFGVADGAPVVGRLMTVGVDVATVRLDGDGDAVLIPIASVTDVVLEGS